MDITEYKKGEIYYLIEVSSEKYNKLNLFKVRLLDMEKTYKKGKYVYIPSFELVSKENIQLYSEISESEKNLGSPISLECESDISALSKEENDFIKRKFGTFIYPKSYILCASLEEGAEKYEAFLHGSLSLMKDNLKKLKKEYKKYSEMYGEQVQWLYGKCDRIKRGLYVPMPNTI